MQRSKSKINNNRKCRLTKKIKNKRKAKSMKGGMNINKNLSNSNKKVMKGNLGKARMDKPPTIKKKRVLNFFNLSNKRYQLYDLISNHNISERTFNAFKQIPRELFMPYTKMDMAYENRPIPIGYEQTVSQPSLVCQMIDDLKLQNNSKVLEIGTGYGYNACIMSLLCDKIYTIEIMKGLSKGAKKNYLFLKNNGVLRSNMKFIHGDGYKGYPRKVKYDRIIATCGSNNSYPPSLGEQLKEGGILLIPIKKLEGEMVIEEKVRKFLKKNGILEEDSTYKPKDVRFVKYEEHPEITESVRIG